MVSKKLNIDMSKEFYNSKIYKFYYQEQQEINKLKWIESEKLGRDIGKSKAIFLWLTKYKSGWVTEYKKISS
jgi:hypothetical protein